MGLQRVLENSCQKGTPSYQPSSQANRSGVEVRSPSVRRAMFVRASITIMRAKNNMALLTEGGTTRATTYKHFPPDGGRATVRTCC